MKKTLKLDCLKAGDSITIIFINILSIIATFYYDSVSLWWLLVLINLIASFTIIIFINYSENKHGLIKIIRDWYWYPIILIVFKEVYFIIQALELTDKDKVLIYIDRLIFGTDPTHWFMKFSHPVLTEYLQISYSMFYFIILASPLYAYLSKNYEEYFYSFYIILLGFYVSYIGYILVPAIGPRFTLHDFYTLDTELPGLLLYKPLRLIINLGESIPPNTTIAALLAQRDCFPSGHTEMTLLAIYLSFKYKQKIKWILLIVGISLIIATVYLRYHYVIDVFAGAFCALLVIVIARPISKIISRKS